MEKIKTRLNLLNENKILNIILKLLLVVAPVIILFLLLHKNSIFNFYSGSKFGDEMDYYRVTNSFVNSKVKFGNYGVSYLGDVSAKFGGFSSHGPKYTLFYGMIGKIFGWHNYSLLLYNIILLVVAMIILIKFNKLDNIKLFAILCLMYVFYPFIYFVVSGMMECLQYIFLIIYSAILYKFLKNPSKKNYIINCLSILFLTLFRINYFIFYIPVIYFYNKKVNKKFFIHLLITLLASFIGYELIGLFSSPYPNYLTEVLSLLKNFQFFEVIKSIFMHSIENLKYYFSFKLNSNMEIAFNLFYVFIIFLNIFMLIKEKKKDNFNVYLYNIFILTISFLIVITIYEVTLFKSIRVLGSLLFMSIVLLIYYDKKKVYSFILICFFIITYFVFGINLFRSEAAGYVTEYPLVTKNSELAEINKYLVCENTNNRWKNTLIVPSYYSYDFNITYGIPSCIGINYVINQDYSQVSKSKYILVSNDETVNKKLYKFVLKNDLGNLYIKK